MSGAKPLATPVKYLQIAIDYPVDLVHAAEANFFNECLERGQRKPCCKVLTRCLAFLRQRGLGPNHCQSVAKAEGIGVNGIFNQLQELSREA